MRRWRVLSGQRRIRQNVTALALRSSHRFRKDRHLAPLGQQHVGGPDANDRREPHRGEGRDDEGGGESDK